MASPITGTITSAGIGSGLDVNSLVSQLVAAEKAPDSDRITKGQAVDNAKLSALGTFKSAISALQTAAQTLEGSSGLGKIAANTSDNTIVTATAASGTLSAFYDVEVVSLATASKQVSGSFANSSTSVGDGTITITVGSKSFSVTTAPGSDTLANLRDAINSADDNTGVNASIVSDSNGAHLVLTSRGTGTANAVSVSSSATADSSNFFTTTQSQGAVDAHIKVDGGDVYSSSNTVSNAIDGVTLNLVKAAPGTTVSLTLSANTSSAATAVQSFVNTYNAVIASMASQTKYDASTNTAGALLGDAAASGFMTQLANLVGGNASGTGSVFSNLSDLGITTQSDGTLKVNTDKLNAALTQDADSVQKLFSADGGYASAIDKLVGTFTASDGGIQAETDSLNSQLKDLQRQSDDLDARMQTVQARYQAQFSALDTLIAQMKSTQDYLTQQLAAIANTTKSS
ncbi:MAG TPA: flagellar filament capping protein FliD [Nevskiaceae bacterium]|nr:flagellar filament capping protein FliD [Nevskiaceae bacterium]